MALKLNATKGMLSVTAAYLMVNGVQMVKYDRPTNDPESGEYTGNVPAAQYTARAQMYANQQDRLQNFGATDFNFAFTFQHVDGVDPVGEAYEHIRAVGLDGWALYDMEDLL